MKSLTRVALARVTREFFNLLVWLLGTAIGLALISMAIAAPGLSILEKAGWMMCTWVIAVAGVILALMAACRVDDALEDTVLGASEAPGVITLFFILALTLFSIGLFEYQTGWYIFIRR